MDKIKILVVEDEIIVAKDIQNSLIKLGYDVPATAASAPSAMDKIAEIKPDLVFLDIKLKGELDGIHIAEHIRQNYNIPVIFLTSYVDKSTLDRAKVTEPYGYIVKPFNENDLRTTVEMALYKFNKDRELRENSQRFVSALQNLEEYIIITDTNGKVTYLNPKAEQLTGYGNDSVQGTDVFMILRIEYESEVLNHESFSSNLSNREAVTFNKATVTILRSQKSFEGTVISSPVRDEKNTLIGNAFLISENAAAEGAPPIAPDQMLSLPLGNQVIQNSFFCKKGSMLVKVYLENIQWIQAMDNYVIIQTNTDQFVVHSTMKDIELKLPPNKFIRVHRSYIVSLEKISVLDENTVMINDKTIPIGKSYKDAFLDKLNFL